jgi:hypothetical protein
VTPPPAPAGRLRVIVLGYVVRGPIGGLAWHHLQYALGLARLGHDVWFVEDSDDYPGCYDPARGVMDRDPTYGLAFADRAFARLGLGERWAYHDAHAGSWHGPAASHARAAVEGADLLLNLSGMNPLREWGERVPRRALVDTDPVFTQIRHLSDPDARARAARHTHFFTFGENVGQVGCTMPDDGLAWRPTRQPVVLDAWPVTPGPAGGAFTTVMQWESYAARQHAGRRYGMKAESFADYLDLPARTGERLELAVGSESAPRAMLAERGWRVRDPLAPTRDPWTYQEYLAGSKGEFGVAKHGYVAARTGWFSERTAAYLASGRPAVVQDTGFTRWLDAGAGVLPFTSPDEARDALARAAGDYARHCRAAREVAAEYFDARAVLPALLAAAGAPPPESMALADAAPSPSFATEGP